jgi:predicted nucleotidyltransferase component of viral defense system
MKSDLENLLKTAENQTQALNWMREYLQVRVLAILQEQGAMMPLAFLGGTALRLLFQFARYSEDLAFSLENQNQGYEFKKYLAAISNELAYQGYPVQVKFNNQKTVHHAFIRFPGLLFDLGLSPHSDQNFTIKLEVDTHPPLGAVLTTSLFRYRELFLNIQHYNKASLFAGKLHAILQRKFLKGRDVYDLVWYLSDRSWPLPNFELLNNALEQTGWNGPRITVSNWKSIIKEKLSKSDLTLAIDDVTPFLSRPQDQAYLKWDLIQKLLSEQES